MIVENKNKHSFTSDTVLVLIWMESLFMFFTISILRWECEKKRIKGEKQTLIVSLISCMRIKSSKHSVMRCIYCFLKLEEKIFDTWHLPCEIFKILYKY